MDRGQRLLFVSDRKAALFLPASASSYGISPNASVSYSTIRRHRIKEREKTVAEAKTNFNFKSPLTVHWDGKKYKDENGNIQNYHKKTLHIE